ncbi:hypothetical protein SESBI_11145 [Sesbania bispinosa]|nr:hypothetical protein SESBI_35519 [Sesbania bispinosa]KAJ1425431.1 hypothetical protein SESBI_11145 [Sesbania bispinosa]
MTENKREVVVAIPNAGGESHELKGVESLTPKHSRVDSPHTICYDNELSAASKSPNLNCASPDIRFIHLTQYAYLFVNNHDNAT